jgi:hypothetical protein
MAMAGIDLCRPPLADAFVGNDFFPFCPGVVAVAGEGTGVHQLLPDLLDLVEITHNVLLWRLWTVGTCTSGQVAYLSGFLLVDEMLPWKQPSPWLHYFGELFIIFFDCLVLRTFLLGEDLEMVFGWILKFL